MLFVLQSIVVGLAVAFLVVLLRPDLLPAVGGNAGAHHDRGRAPEHGRVPARNTHANTTPGKGV